MLSLFPAVVNNFTFVAVCFGFVKTPSVYLHGFTPSPIHLTC